MDYFLDSNILLRFFADDKKGVAHIECSKLIKNIKEGKIKAYTSHLVLAEVVWTLDSYYETPRESVVKVLKTIESLGGLTIIDKFETYLANKIYSEKTVKFIDALIASSPKIQSRKMAVVSYDKDFDKLGVIRKEPSQIC
ncbi:MAG: PilT protein domain protein [Candidatus Amesbacteria bacterium GW2011_GWA1_44_24]|nr:MAG: PilT protein domain protein [Candidatus Amesbacteria bacterium GW2011_GWA1_44_24]